MLIRTSPPPLLRLAARASWAAAFFTLGRFYNAPPPLPHKPSRSARLGCRVTAFGVCVRRGPSPCAWALASYYAPSLPAHQVHACTRFYSVFSFHRQ